MNLRISPRLLKSEPLRRCRLEECQAACCLHGAWVDLAEIEDILAHAKLITPQMPTGAEQPWEWFDERLEVDQYAISGKVGHTRVLRNENHYGGTACIFLRPDYKCALQVTADREGLHPWRFKPFYCILHPLDLDGKGNITLDETKSMLSESGSCLRHAAKSIPLIETFAEELSYLLGEKGYRELKMRFNPRHQS
jgi:hypothetical protein